MASFTERVIRAARLDATLYEEVEADRSATRQALTVVALSAVAAGIGSFGQSWVAAPVAMVILSLISWVIWAGVTWVIGTKLLPEAETKSDMGELLRTLGFASAPGLIQVFQIIPGIRALVMIVAMLWMIAATVIAVRQALDYKSTVRAVIVVLIGAFVYGGIMRVVGALVVRQAGA